MACTGRKSALKGIAMKIGSGTYGVDSVPTAALNALPASNITIAPLIAEQVEDAIDRPGGGNDPTILVGKHVSINFDMAMMGAGSAGGIPIADVPLLGCALAKVVNAGTDVRYTRVTANEAWVDIYFWMDGALHKALGARGNVTAEINAGGVPMWKFSFLALYAGPDTAVNPALNLSTYRKPNAVSNAATAYSFHGITPAVSAFTFDAGNVVVHDDKPGCEEVFIEDQKPKAQITLDAPSLAGFDPFGIAGEATGTTSVIQNSIAGDIVQIIGEYTELNSVDYGDAKGKLGYSHDAKYLPDPAGVNPDFTIIFK